MVSILGQLQSMIHYIFSYLIHFSFWLHLNEYIFPHVFGLVCICQPFILPLIYMGVTTRHNTDSNKRQRSQNNHRGSWSDFNKCIFICHHQAVSLLQWICGSSSFCILDLKRERERENIALKIVTDLWLIQLQKQKTYSSTAFFLEQQHLREKQ